MSDTSHEHEAITRRVSLNSKLLEMVECRQSWEILSIWMRRAVPNIR